jgi:hypothetical protein
MVYPFDAAKFFGSKLPEKRDASRGVLTTIAGFSAQGLTD